MCTAGSNAMRQMPQALHIAHDITSDGSHSRTGEDGSCERPWWPARGVTNLFLARALETLPLCLPVECRLHILAPDECLVNIRGESLDVWHRPPPKRERKLCTIATYVTRAFESSSWPLKAAQFKLSLACQKQKGCGRQREQVCRSRLYEGLGIKED